MQPSPSPSLLLFHLISSSCFHTFSHFSPSLSKVRPVLEYESGGKASQLEKVDGNLRELQSRMDMIQSEVTRLEQEVAHYTKVREKG